MLGLWGAKRRVPPASGKPGPVTLACRFLGDLAALGRSGPTCVPLARLRGARDTASGLWPAKDYFGK